MEFEELKRLSNPFFRLLLVNRSFFNRFSSVEKKYFFLQDFRHPHKQGKKVSQILLMSLRKKEEESAGDIPNQGEIPHPGHIVACAVLRCFNWLNAAVYFNISD